LAAAKSQIARAYHQDTMANANRLMGQKTVARTKSPFKEWQAASAAFMKDPGKPITPDFLLKQNRGAEVVETSLNLVGELRDLIAEGGGLGRIESMSAAGWLANSKSATMYSRLKSFVRRIKRAAGVDVGNLALKEGTIMVESVLGNNWSRAQTAKEEMTKEAMTQLKTWAGVYKGLSINNDVRELDPAKKRIATAVDRYWRGEAIAKAKKKKRK